jgi:BirA family biotin operon repressor/biotin-[acetyl-CoA-carboxylase] ligase
MKLQVEWFERLASTNTHLREQFLESRELESGHIVAARVQTEGRGRQERKWLSSPGRDLCFSLLVLPGTRLASATSLPMAAALAVTDALTGAGIPAAPKWPNDVLVGEKKICGILSEHVERQACAAGGEDTTRNGIIVGIGLNVNMSAEEAEAIDRPATSLLIETGKQNDVPLILESLLQPLTQWIDEWEKGGFASLRETWTEKAGPIGKPLVVHDGETRTRGTLAGFGEQGELLLQTDDGLKTIWSGDVFNL